MRRDINEEIMHATWLATTACCTALHDIGFDAEEIAEEMPHCIKQLGNASAAWVFPGDGIKYPLLAGDAIKLGQDYAERLAAKRAGVRS